MGKVYDTIDDKLATWIAAQSVFFVGTAPIAGDGHVNVSPKGPIETLRILGPRLIAYVDLIGSGAETIAHLRDDGRIVVMLCAFEGPPALAAKKRRENGFADYVRERTSLPIDGVAAVS